ncbi:putative chemoreceptor glutamine deamidase CheD 2 [Bacteroidia bacterium]|nr:putative chemoreceptor glutamine deamidase CheD 2 [Bacteroidia bacterium]
MESLPKHLLYPADVFVPDKSYLVSTVLGSCVSVCLYSPDKQMGAINHYILPLWNGSDLETMKYGNLSIIRIVEGLLSFGCNYDSIEAQVYGGAEVLTGASTRFHIGQRNIAIANEMLKEFRIPITFSDVGGNRGRKITFNTQTGEVESYLIHRRKELDELDETYHIIKNTNT